MKKVRSLKTEIPPPEELDRARDQILEQLALFNTQRDKVKSYYSSEAEQRHQEGLMEHITELLRRHKRPKQSVVAVYNQVSMACEERS